MRDSRDVSHVVVDDGVRLAYRVGGPNEAPALVFSNSLGMDLQMWEPQIPAFAGRFRVVRYDTRGHGHSDVPPGPYTLERLGRDLLALLDALQIERAHICGLSLGGMTAQWLAVYRPERVFRAVFANTAARIGSEASWDERIASVRAGGLHSIRDASLGRYFSEPFRQRHPDVAQHTGDLLEATPEDGYIAACGALRDADLRGVVGGIRAPALIVAGALDQATPAAHGQELHAAIAGSELAILDAAHLSNIERADEFNARVLAFLTQP